MDKTIATTVYKDPIIRPDDILSVSVITIDPTTSAPVNQTAPLQVNASSSTSVPLVPGLLVDKTGCISLPIYWRN